MEGGKERFIYRLLDLVETELAESGDRQEQNKQTNLLELLHFSWMKCALRWIVFVLFWLFAVPLCTVCDIKKLF